MKEQEHEMSLEPSVEEIFSIAERIEREARGFYESAAARADVVRGQVFLHLAKMEKEHEWVFAALKDQSESRLEPANLPTLGQMDPPPDVDVVLMAGDTQGSLARQFTGSETSDEILQKAIEFEKNSIVFFYGLRGMLSDESDREKIDGIVREELGHVLALTGERSGRGGRGAGRAYDA